MRILLVWPPMTVYLPDPKIPSPSLPLGLAYIAAVLEKENYYVRILDALALGVNRIEKGHGWLRCGLGDDEIKGYVKNFDPDVVGISSMFTAYAQDVHNCARIVKEFNPDIPVVVGGAHASVNPEMILDRNIDIVVKGEGEITLLELVNNLENEKTIFKIPGTVVRKKDKIFYNPKRPYIKDLDSLPFPARHLLPMEVYMEHSEQYGEYIMRQPSLALITSRGCPRRCVFCSIHSVWGHTWRGRSAKNVVNEIEFLINRYRAREIAFLDDNLTLNKKRTMETCEEIIKRELDIKWCTPNGVALWALDKQVIKKMKESGCYRLTFGIESGSRETQKFIGKIINLDHARSLIKYANKIGLWTVCTFIIGFPYEKRDSIIDSIEYAINSDTDFALFYILGPFPGTPVYEIFKREGLLSKNNQNWGYILGGGGCNTKFFTAEELRKWQAKAQSDFLKRRIYSFLTPLRIIDKINSFEDFVFAVKIAKNAFRMKTSQLIIQGDVKSMLYKRYQRDKQSEK